MIESIRYPIFLTQGCWAIDYELLLLIIVRRSRLHFYRIISEAELCQAETPNQVERVNLVEQIIMSVVVQCET